MVKSIYSPFHGREVRLGRTQRQGPPLMSLNLGNYVHRHKLPDPPATTDYTGPAATALSNVYLNDQLGDCVIAGMYHCVGVWTGGAGNLFVASNDQITKDYSAIGGYVPGDSATDQGCNEDDACNWWISHGYANGDKPLGFLTVDPTNATLLRQAIYLFEHVYWGFCLPDGWLNPMPQKSGFTWDVSGSPDQNNGHCVMSCGYGANGANVATWGMLGTLTWGACAKYGADGAGGNSYVILSPDMVAKAQAKAPNGIDWATLVADFDSIGGKVPVPTPVVPPTPPTPPPGPTPGPTPPDPGGWSDI